MKYIVLVCVIGLMTSEAAKKYYTDCTNVMGGCAGGCPEGMHRGYEACSKHHLPEPTCYDPKPLPVRDMVCVYTNLCYCNPPTVRDLESNRCVRIQDCGLSAEFEE